MHRPFHPTAFALWRRRGQLTIGSHTSLAPSALFSIDRGSRITLGTRCRIDHGVVLATYGGSIEIGDRVSVNPYTILYGHGGLRIGDETRIAAHCTIVPADHVFADAAVPIRQQGLVKRGIEIGRDVWIGAGCRILDGARIGDGSVIAAGAVVRGELAPYCVYGGVPARNLKDRGETGPGQDIRTDGARPST